MKKIKRTCYECGIGMIQKQARAGRKAAYKNMSSLPIPDSFQIPTCSVCGAEWLDQETGKALDEALEAVYRQELTHRAKQALLLLSEAASQKKVETLLGLSSGYLSKIVHEERIPSAELVSELALLARDPKNRLSELEEFWMSPISSEPVHS